MLLHVFRRNPSGLSKIRIFIPGMPPHLRIPAEPGQLPLGVLPGAQLDFSNGVLQPLRVVHGRGTGALRSAVHKKLKKLKYVKEFRLGEFGEGDSGVTIVIFK